MFYKRTFTFTAVLGLSSFLTSAAQALPVLSELTYSGKSFACYENVMQTTDLRSDTKNDVTLFYIEFNKVTRQRNADEPNTFIRFDFSPDSLITKKLSALNDDRSTEGMVINQILIEDVGTIVKPEAYADRAGESLWVLGELTHDFNNDGLADYRASVSIESSPWDGPDFLSIHLKTSASAKPSYSSYPTRSPRLRSATAASATIRHHIDII